MSLFRPEVALKQRNQLLGDIRISLPPSWHVIGLFLIMIVLVGFGFLASHTYARVEMVTGTVVPKDGLLQILPSRPGVVTQVFVQEGEAIAAGAPLAFVRTEDTLPSGQGTTQELGSAMDMQASALDWRRTSINAASKQELREIETQQVGLRAEIESLDDQIKTQSRLVDIARTDWDSVQEVGRRGFLSKRDLNAREAVLLQRTQQLSVLRQAKAAKISELNRTEHILNQARSRADAAAADLQNSQSQLRERRANMVSGRGYLITAPANGRVTALSIHVGDPAPSGQAIMAIVPQHSELVAEIFVPGKSIGFIDMGQKVSISADAYPSERFGTLEARVVSISKAPVLKAIGTAQPSPVYVVSAALSRPHISAYGVDRPLLPGMAFHARVVTDRRSLFAWIFDPLFAAGRE